MIPILVNQIGAKICARDSHAHTSVVSLYRKQFRNDLRWFAEAVASCGKSEGMLIRMNRQAIHIRPDPNLLSLSP